jgi:RNA polymerase sigma factor (sigma-70 family)
MRHVLIDHARKKGAVRHGGLMTRVTLSEDVQAEPAVVDLNLLSEAIARLETLSERQAAVIDMRFIGGLTVEEVASSLQVSEKTVKNDTRVALAWLRRELDLK